MPGPDAHLNQKIKNLADLSSPFERMASEVKKFDAARFAGAAVLISPDGTVVEFLMQDITPDTPMFWGTLKTRIQIALEEAQNEEQKRNPFRRGGN